MQLAAHAVSNAVDRQGPLAEPSLIKLHQGPIEVSQHGLRDRPVIKRIHEWCGYYHIALQRQPLQQPSIGQVRSCGDECTAQEVNDADRSRRHQNPVTRNLLPIHAN